MGAISFSVTDNGTSFGICPHLPWTRTASSQMAYFKVLNSVPFRPERPEYSIPFQKPERNMS